ncbi:hypothetical protein V7266_28865, partial [Neobacillus drentensis]|uniref:hypothetical protein n=1 Tax=Neobacillus drentensis TaxID=220684 RepID=UPI002FFE2015
FMGHSSESCGAFLAVSRFIGGFWEDIGGCWTFIGGFFDYIGGFTPFISFFKNRYPKIYSM